MSLKVGIQLYSVREEMAKDPIATVKKVADIGYKYLEFANSHADTDPGVGFGVSAEELRQFVAAQPGHRYSYCINSTNVHFDIPKVGR